MLLKIIGIVTFFLPVLPGLVFFFERLVLLKPLEQFRRVKDVPLLDIGNDAVFDVVVLLVLLPEVVD